MGGSRADSVARESISAHPFRILCILTSYSESTLLATRLHWQPLIAFNLSEMQVGASRIKIEDDNCRRQMTSLNRTYKNKYN